MKATALVVPPIGNCYSVNLPEESAFVIISEHIGGHFDVVRMADVVGYVHDEGLLIGLSYNVRASMLFGVSLVGNCVLVGCLDNDGNFDGDDYDVPQQYLDLMSQWQVIPITTKETETE